MNLILGYSLTYFYIMGVIIIVTFLNKKCLNNEISRKLIHILVGLSWFIMTFYFKTTWHLIIPPITFIIINYISYKYKIISSMAKEKDSKGTIYYAISFTVLALITIIYPTFLPFYGIGVLTMALGDGLAPFAGKLFPKAKIGNTNKTYAGSLTIFIISLIINLTFKNIYLLPLTSLDILIISIAAPILELIDFQDYDNLTLPLGIALISWLLTL